MKNLSDPPTYEGVDKVCFFLKANYRRLIKGPTAWQIDRSLDKASQRNLLSISRAGVVRQYEKCD